MLGSEYDSEFRFAVDFDLYRVQVGNFDQPQLERVGRGSEQLAVVASRIVTIFNHILSVRHGLVDCKRSLGLSKLSALAILPNVRVLARPPDRARYTAKFESRALRANSGIDCSRRAISSRNLIPL